MNALLVLVPVSFILIGIAIWAFFWAVRSGQFESLDSAAFEPLSENSSPISGPISSTAASQDSGDVH